MSAPKSVDTFELVFEFEYEHVPIVMYRCKKTGLRLGVAKVQSPVVQGYFTVQTEAFTDYGEPHTLEHLIFMGSEKYPYKGVLDVLANRCLAQGTNAWTDTDHTCYTVGTAGSEGFLRILPVYLDHILFPTLKDSAFVTEVHHINGAGGNAGVVYCEMQARENEASDMVDRAMRLAAYPGPCSYKSETGGRLEELRELTNEMVKDYHKQYYRPENLCVIVAGQVDYTDFCKAVAPVVESIEANGRLKGLPPFERPFLSSLPRPTEPSVTRMEFPAEDEESGAICEFAWHGPRWEELEETAGLSMLFNYLTQDAISPMRKAFVETDPPLCGKTSYSMSEQTVHLYNLTLENVNMKELEKRDVDAELTAVLKNVADKDGANIDLARLQSLIKQKRRQSLSEVEGSPHDVFSGEFIGSFLYAPDFAPNAPASAKPGEAFQARLDKGKLMDKLLQWSASQWAALCDKWILPPKSSPRVTIIGKPSKACGKNIQDENNVRTEKQIKELGPDGCVKAGEALAKAEEENDVETPEELEQSFSIPDVSKMKLIELSTVAVDGAKSKVDEVSGIQATCLKEQLQKAGNDGKFPNLRMQFDHVQGSQFVECHALIPLDELSKAELQLLLLWRDVMFELPLSASDNGPAMNHDSVVQALTDVTVRKGCGIGVAGGRFNAGSGMNMLEIDIKVEKNDYKFAPLWIARLLADAEFDVERLRSAAKRILNDVPNQKRNGKQLMRLAMRAMKYQDKCAVGVANPFRVEAELKKLLKKGKQGKPDGLDQVAEKLTKLRNKLLTNCAFIRVGGDVLALGDQVFEPWVRAPFSSSGVKASSVKPALAREMYASDKINPKSRKTLGCMIMSSAEETNYWSVQSNSFTDPRSPKLAPLLVAIEYLDAGEGPFWRKIRGKGLAYGYSLGHSLETGTMNFGLFKASDPVAAFQQATDIVKNICANERPDKKQDKKDKHEEDEEEGESDEEESDDDGGFDEVALESAQSGVIFGLIQSVDTMPGAMDQGFDNMLSRQPADQLQWLLKEVQNVDVASVQKVMKQEVLPLFTGSKGRVVSMMCPTELTKKLVSQIKQLKPAMNLVQLEVDGFAKELALPDGFSEFRERVRKEAKEKVTERRVDPEDGIAYTFDEICQYYAGVHTKKIIRAYWEAECTQPSQKKAKKGDSAGFAEERRIDPEDDISYTWAEISSFYAGKYKNLAIKKYWEMTCQPETSNKVKSGKQNAVDVVRKQRRAKHNSQAR